jgi:hypothetical protein
MEKRGIRDKTNNQGTFFLGIRKKTEDEMRVVQVVDESKVPREE